MPKKAALNRRRFCGTAAATIAVAPLALAGLAERSNAMSQTIRPFRVSFPDSEIADLRNRIKATRWPDRETVSDSTQGVPLQMMQVLAAYWASDYDWRKCETKLNSLPQYLTEIDGLDIHFIHVRSKHENALPIIVTHGWPGSIIEQLKIIEPLTNPTAHGGSASDAFHVVIPSIPGYGFSAKPTTIDWDTSHVARAWTVLMKRLGYTKFVAQGGDVGSVVTTLMAEQAPRELLCMHTSLPAAVPKDIAKALACGEPVPNGLSADEAHAYEQLQLLYGKQFAYAAFMHTRPQTLYGLADSPVGLAAWLLDHGDGGGQPAAAVVSALSGQTTGGYSAGDLTRDDVLDNITMYWLTKTAVSAARSYWLNKTSPLNAADVSIPAAATVFPAEIYQAPRSWTERAFHNLIYFNKAAAGGHFAAWEQPQIFAQEMRAAFRSLRT